MSKRHRYDAQTWYSRTESKEKKPRRHAFFCRAAAALRLYVIPPY